MSVNRLYPTWFLVPGASIISWNGRRNLLYQNDGNVVMYKNDGTTDAIWSTKTYGSTSNMMVMQPDGNLVVYDASWNPIWASNTFDNRGAYLYLQDDGNLVIYRKGGGPEISGSDLWASDTYL